MTATDDDIREFKSDRCGIEISKMWLQKLKKVLFKSDRCGIEINQRSTFHADLIYRSNQTVAGLKLRVI